MLEKLVTYSVKNRGVVLAFLVLLLGAGGFAAMRLPIDAMPDVTTDIRRAARRRLWCSCQARKAVTKGMALPSAYRIEWGGQFENFDRAQKRLQVVIPIVVAIILGMLLITFRNVQVALAVFATVPLSFTGGMLGLLLRGMPFSLSAAVGFIALGGVAVLNGVIIGQQVLVLLQKRAPVSSAVTQGSVSVVRAVLSTAAVAAVGFLPMALSQGAGAEVQRPLATTVVAGITFGTLITLLVLPGILAFALRCSQKVRRSLRTDFEGERA